MKNYVANELLQLICCLIDMANELIIFSVTRGQVDKSVMQEKLNQMNYY